MELSKIENTTEIIVFRNYSLSHVIYKRDWVWSSDCTLCYSVFNVQQTNKLYDKFW